MCNLTAIGFILYYQSVGRSTCACRRERWKLSRQGLAFVLLQSLGLFLMSCEKCLFFMWCAGGGGAGGGGGGSGRGAGAGGQLFPISARVEQSASCGQGERQGETQRSENTSN